MTLNVLLILVLLAIALALSKWRRCSRALLVLTAILWLAIGCGPVPIGLLTGLQSAGAEDAPIAWGQRNAIVLLGAGTVRTADGQVEAKLSAYGRISKAAMRSGWASPKLQSMRMICGSSASIRPTCCSSRAA